MCAEGVEGRRRWGPCGRRVTPLRLPAAGVRQAEIWRVKPLRGCTRGADMALSRHTAQPSVALPSPLIHGCRISHRHEGMRNTANIHALSPHAGRGGAWGERGSRKRRAWPVKTTTAVKHTHDYILSVGKWCSP